MKNLRVLLKSLFSILLLSPSFNVFGQPPDERKLVYHLKVQAEIDPRTNRYTELGLDAAVEANADYIILELDTYGGTLDDADDIRTRILNTDTPIYAFINKNAASAGALISIACDSIYMASGSSIGAATVVTAEGEAAPDKYQSYMRSMMRSTAEAKGRNPEIAEAMVDEDIDLDSVATEGKVLTFSVKQAIEYHFCEAMVSGIGDIMERSGVEHYDVETFELNTTNRIVAVFLNPFISGILILIIIGGIYFELQTPGVGFPIAASIVAAVLYFIPYYLNGLAENWEIVMFLVGILLLAVEIFVIPGFGVAGIAGLICSLGAMVLVMLNNDMFDFSFVDPGEIFIAVSTTLAGLMGSIIVMFLGGVRLANSKVFASVALQETQDKSRGYTSRFIEESMKGKTGTAFTILRPSGKVMIEGSVYDAYTRGEYIAQGADVEVLSDEGTSLKVRASSP